MKGSYMNRKILISFIFGRLISSPLTVTVKISEDYLDDAH